MSRTPPKPPARITDRYLRWMTDRYLSRYTTTRSHLRRLMLQRVQRSAAHHGDDLEPLTELVDGELDRLERLGLINDGLFARDRARALHRRGNSARAIRAKLGAKGLRGEVVDDALAALAEEHEDPEWVAACKWARKRRIGPWSRSPVDRELKQKQLARFGRAGFGYDVARRVLELEDPPA